MSLLTQIIDRLGYDPFTYLIWMIIALAIWMIAVLSGEFLFGGHTLWLRRIALLASFLSALLFAQGMSDQM